jgi:hypothetical protein
MQTAGRIDQDNIGLSSFGRGNPVVGHCRRIRAMPMADHLDTDPIGPDLKLVNRGGTKGIGRDEHRDALTLDQSLRELGYAGGLSDPIDSNHEDDKRFRSIGDQLLERRA